MTVIEIATDEVPPVLVAVIAYPVAPEIAVGVPLMTQVLDKASVPGRVGLATHETLVPPVLAGFTVAIALPFINVNGLPAYEMPGGTACTAIFKVALAVPAAFVAVITWLAAALKAVGVPDNTQVLDKLSPAGKTGADAQETIVPPRLVGVSVDIVEPRV